ncbi:hypothetical protein [Aminipila sp.]|uniref:hypothetical protein n=1 Tax=Aminipila sp. TaxID=2060095 RepID=UPI002896D272|nr:hypothetical protein [Aminipila sp.]
MAEINLGCVSVYSNKDSENHDEFMVELAAENMASFIIKIKNLAEKFIFKDIQGNLIMQVESGKIVESGFEKPNLQLETIQKLRLMEQGKLNVKEFELSAPDEIEVLWSCNQIW